MGVCCSQLFDGQPGQHGIIVADRAKLAELMGPAAPAPAAAGGKPGAGALATAGSPEPGGHKAATGHSGKAASPGAGRVGARK
jgi:hypothetical protein